MENLWIILKIIIIIKRVVILVCFGKKENVCVCVFVCESEWVVDMYVCFMLGLCIWESVIYYEFAYWIIGY